MPQERYIPPYLKKKKITILSVRANVYYFEMSFRFNKAYYCITEMNGRKYSKM